MRGVVYPIEARAARGAWQPIETVPEGVHVLLWFPIGERGVGGMECGTVYLKDDLQAPRCGVEIWTHGGPNAGSDWYTSEAPTHWMPLPAPPR